MQDQTNAKPRVNVPVWIALCLLNLVLSLPLRAELSNPAETTLLKAFDQEANSINSGREWDNSHPFVHQPDVSVQRLYEMAESAALDFQRRVNLISSKHHWPAKLPSDDQGRPLLKNRARVSELFRGGRGSHDVLDVSRGTLLIDYNDMPGAIAELKQAFGASNIAAAADRVNHSLGAYRGDFSLYIRDPKTGFISELMLMPKEIWDAKELEHPLFEIRRSIQARLHEINSPASREEQQQIDSLEEKAKETFSAAFKSALTRATEPGKFDCDVGKLRSGSTTSY